MQYFQFHHDADDLDALELDEGIVIALHNEARENGYRDDESGPLSWLNSARVVLDPKEDSVTFCASIGDPRGAFTFTLRRKPDGGLIIHMPHPGEGMAHEETRELHPGTLEVGQWVPMAFAETEDIKLDFGGQHRRGPDGHNVQRWHPADRSDPEPEWMELIPDLTREKCNELIASTGDVPYDNEPLEEQRKFIKQRVLAGDLEPNDLEA